VGAIVDRLWFAIDHSVPNWDQADYLTGALNYRQAFQTAHWFSADWWLHLWQLSTKIPPLVYISTVPFLNLFGGGFDQSTLVNLVYSAILLGSVYALGVCLFSVSAGLWAAGLCLLMPGLYRVRLDYLLDYPLAAMVTLCFACLTLWRGWGVGSRESGVGSGKLGVEKRESAVGGREAGVESQHGALGKSFLFTLYSSLLTPHSSLHQWLLAAAFGLTLGLALLVKQPALLFLFVPIAWVAVEIVWRRDWERLAQWVLAMGLALLVFGPWYRTNWLLMLSASKRATVDSAIAEGDPSLLSLDAWTFYLRMLPSMVSLPLLLVGLAGLLFFWRRSRVSSQWLDEEDYAPKTKSYRQQIYAVSRRSVGWLLIFCVSGYLLSSLNINKDARYVVPYLPVVSILLAYGFLLLPKHWKPVRWGALGLAGVLMLNNLLPLKPHADLRNSFAYHPAYTGVKYPHAEVVAEVIKTEPYLRNAIGVLPSTAEVNQHNINYYGNLRNFQVYGRQVGVRLKQVEQDGRSLSWFITKSGDQGSIRKQDAQKAISKFVEQGGDFSLHKTWKLPDGSNLQLFRRRIPLLEVSSVIGGREPGIGSRESGDKRVKGDGGVKGSGRILSLDQVIVPQQVPPGKPVPVTYRWSGEWETLQAGLVLLNWRKQGNLDAKSPTRWFHDHAIAVGSLHSATSIPVAKGFSVSWSSNSKSSSYSTTRYQVVERTAMLPPANAAPGTYTLEATYLNRQTGKTMAIAVPPVSLQINPTAAATPAPELDFSTQLQTLAEALPQGSKALDAAFIEIGRLNQYDPTQDYIEQTRQAMEYRLKQEPKNLKFAYTLAIANVLQRRVNPAIAALQKVTQLDAKNPSAYAYLAFVNLYDFRPKAAQQALNVALKLNPNLPELQALSGVAALMRGNLVQAWKYAQAYEKKTLEKSKS
jgi:4-amino-4-deoxy-L-arabinose transferase-like glycosyltransferase